MLDIVEGKLSSANIDEQLHFCPVCSEMVFSSFVQKFPSGTGDVWVWLRCACGTMFSARGQNLQKAQERNRVPEPEITEDLVPKLLHPYTVYMPMIEEIAPSRKFLGIGHRSAHGQEWVRDRGWVVYGDGARPDDKSPMDCIWLDNWLQTREDWRGAMRWVWDHLGTYGLAYLDMPDTSIASIKGFGKFPHLLPWENKILWRMETFVEYVKGTGFNVILARRNEHHRCLRGANMQVILQKRGAS